MADRSPAAHEAWLVQRAEAALDPERRIIDPHHHLWHHPETPYLLANLRADTGSGHNIVATVFVECTSEYRKDGPAHLREAGETEFVAGIAKASEADGGTRIAAIVGSADLQRDPGLVDELLDAHIAAGGGRFRGVRHAAAWDASPDIRVSHHNPPPALYRDPAFRAGFARLAARNMTFDAWLYHPQIPDLTDLARAFPGATIIVDHFGGPLGIGPYAGRRDDVFAAWKRDFGELARCRNVVAKLGGLAMPINGFGWHKAARPPSSDEVVAVQGDWYRFAIDAFGPDRCMFESNFPVDRASLPYGTLWNAFKKLVAGYSDSEKDALFRGTAARVYGIAA